MTSKKTQTYTVQTNNIEYNNLRYHKINGVSYMPGSYFLQHIINIGLERHATLTNIVFISAVKLETSSANLIIEIKKKNKASNAAIYLCKNKEEKIRKAFGCQIIPNFEIKGNKKKTLKNTKEMPEKLFYTRLKNKGNVYEKSFKVLNKINYNDKGEARAEIESTQSLHLLLDGCLQLLQIFNMISSAVILKSIKKLSINHTVLTNHSLQPLEVFVKQTKGKEGLLVGNASVFLKNKEILRIEGITYIRTLPENNASYCVNMAGNFTLDFFEKILSHFKAALNLPIIIRKIEHNQAIQALIEKASLFYEFSNSANIIFLSPDKLASLSALTSKQDTCCRSPVFPKNTRIFTLPNKVRIAHLNSYETEYLYEEIFSQNSYIKNGIEINDGDCVVDIGANIGMFSLFLKQHYKDLKIFALEPIPKIFKILQANFRAHKLGEAFQLGVGRKSEQRLFTFYTASSVFSTMLPDTQEDISNIESIIRNHVLQKNINIKASEAIKYFKKNRSQSKKILCQITNFSEFIDKNKINHIKLLKIDAERAELDILQGINEEHWKIIDQIVMEFHGNNQKDLELAISLLKEKSFLILKEKSSVFSGTPFLNIYATKIKARENNMLYKKLSLLGQAILAYSNNTHIPLFIILCPANPGYTGSSLYYQHIERNILSNIEKHSHIHLITNEQLKIQNVFSKKPSFHEADIIYNNVFHEKISIHLLRKLYMLWHPPHKAIMVDCDNTLWDGACAEQTPEAITISKAKKILQKFLLDQYRKGIVLCLCSKNIPEDVLSVFKKNNDMILGLKHISAKRINWQNKSYNLLSLANELNISVNSFFCIDDNPAEAAELSSKYSGIQVLMPPKNAKNAKKYFNNIWGLDFVHLTKEDKARIKFYTLEQSRVKLKEKFLSFQDFLKELAVKMSIKPLQQENIPRIIQLTQRTTQFNSQTTKQTSDKIKKILKDKFQNILQISAKDKFGDYGLIGMVHLAEKNTTLLIKHLLLSCRALGKGLEAKLMLYLKNFARLKNLEKIAFYHTRTNRNLPLYIFFQNFNGLEKRTKRVYIFDSSQISEKPQSSKKIKHQGASSRHNVMVFNPNIDAIAKTLSFSAQKEEAKVLQLNMKNLFSDSEQKVVEILNSIKTVIRARADRDKSLFNLGFTSLDLVLFAGRLYSEANINMPFDTLYENNSVTSIFEYLKKQKKENKKADERILSRNETSLQQQALWVYDALHSNDIAYNVPIIFTTHSAIDKIVIANALQALLKRHDQLGKVFYEKDGLILSRSNKSNALIFEIEKKHKKEIPLILRNYGGQKFQLDKGPLVRVKLIETNTSLKYLIIVIHHICIDYHSIEIIIRDLWSIYHNLLHKKQIDDSLSATMTYAGYIQKQKIFLKSAKINARQRYWQQKIINFTKNITTPYNASLVCEEEYSCLHHYITIQDKEGLLLIAKKENISLHTLLLTLLSISYYKTNRQRQYVFSIPASERYYGEYTKTVGYFINLIPIFFELHDNLTIQKLLKYVKKEILSATYHNSLPYTYIQRIAAKNNLQLNNIVFDYQESLLFPYASSFINVSTEIATFYCDDLKLESSRNFPLPPICNELIQVHTERNSMVINYKYYHFSNHQVIAKKMILNYIHLLKKVAADSSIIKKVIKGLL